MRHLRCASAVACLFIAAALHAQAPRTFVSSTGNDANPCSRIAPCRNFQAAVTAVASGGEVVALDSAGYGPFTIDRSVTVTADGVHAAVTAPLPGDAITISGTTTSVIVVLRNLAILGPPGGPASSNGVSTADGALIGMLVIDGCTISGVNLAALFRPGLPSQMYVRNSVIRSSGGISALPPLGSSAFVGIDETLFERVPTAVLAEPGTTFVVTRSVATGGTGNSQGVFAAGGGTTALLTLMHCAITQNGVAISAHNGATVRVGDTALTGNTTGLLTTTGGVIVSLTGNHLANTTDGTFNSALASQ